MKRFQVIGLTLVSLIWAISFEPPVKLHEVDFTFEGKPTVVDWDGDGLVDILFGERIPVPKSDTTMAFVTLWKNTGTKTEPEFSKADTLKADGDYLCVGVG